MRLTAWNGMLLFGVVAWGTLARAEPVDLRDARARPVNVALEISPPHLPARLDHVYSERAPAWFEPGPAPHEVTIRVSGPEVEQLLAHFDPIPGSFGDFVWILDVESGHVLSASLSGAMLRRVDWGILETRVRAKIVARMTTLRAAGFHPPRSLLGSILFDHCGGRDDDCTLVAPRAYDPFTGYVNAVGSLSARAGGLSTDTFSPLGEAVFTEMASDAAVSAR